MTPRPQSRDRSPRLLACAVVTLPALDLRVAPDHASELGSQLLMGEVVRVLATDRTTASQAGWWRVENSTDRYRGWVRNWGVVPCSASRASRWRERARARVAVSYAEARTEDGAALVSPLFWNGHVIAGRVRGGRREVELPDGRRGWVAADALTTGRSRVAIGERFPLLLGVPYLWGGRTPMGIDCSALVQQLYAEQGIALPRDARDQFAATRAVAPGSERPGDLVFFAATGKAPGHVGLLLGGGYFVHSRGRVRVGSLDPHNALCDSDLLRQLLSARRPMRGPIRVAPRGSRGEKPA